MHLTLISPLSPIVNILVTSYCTAAAQKRFCISRKGGTVGGGWDHPQGAVHMAAARLGCKRAMVRPGGPTLALAA